VSGQHLVLYDGVCGLCNGLVQFVLPRDKAGTLDFASLQSGTGRSWLQRFGRDPDQLETFVVVTNYRGDAPGVLVKARAALFVARSLPQPWRLAVVAGVLPERLLNRVYDAIARRRYRVFGRSDTCVLPSPEQRGRIIDV
jgi:predicted DCC family thiol-disulfide oxidoreductase YuxK